MASSERPSSIDELRGSRHALRMRPVRAEHDAVGAHDVDDLGEVVLPERRDVYAALERHDRVLGEVLWHLAVDVRELLEADAKPRRRRSPWTGCAGLGLRDSAPWATSAVMASSMGALAHGDHPERVSA